MAVNLQEENKQLQRRLQETRLYWTTEPPTVPGWYWVKDKTNVNRAVDFWEDQDISSLVGNGYPISGFKGCKFAGPIPVPEEA